MWTPLPLDVLQLNSGRSTKRPLKQPARRLVLEPLEERCLLSAGLAPNDARFHQQWGLEVTEARLAWELTTGSTAVTAAVIDTGVDYTHPDLYKNIWINQREIPKHMAKELVDDDGDGLITFWDLNTEVNLTSGLVSDLNGTGYIDGGDLLADPRWANNDDDDRNGFEDDLIGWDFFENDNDPIEVDVHVQDPHLRRFGHGTFIAGVMGAEGNNGIGVAGINWQIQIMPLRATPPNQAVTIEAFEKGIMDVTAAVRYATSSGARVSNISSGAPANIVSPELSDAVLAAFQEAAEADHLIVGSAGNDAIDNDSVAKFPWSSYGENEPDNLIVVAATFKNDGLAGFSNVGRQTVDLGAPGDLIWGIHPVSDSGVEYGHRSGTSHSAPHVAGAAALIWSRNPGLGFAEVKSLVLDNVDPLPDLQGETVTGGRLNIFNAVSATPLARAGGIAAHNLQYDVDHSHSGHAGNHGVDVVPSDPQDWPMYNHDPQGSRHNFAEHILSPKTVGDLEVQWTYPTAGPIAGTPAVVKNRIYAADATGVVYALDRDGELLWQTALDIGPTISNVKLTTSALVTNRTVVIGDQSGQIHGLDVDSGAVKWTTTPNPHPFAAIWGSATMVATSWRSGPPRMSGPRPLSPATSAVTFAARWCCSTRPPGRSFGRRLRSPKRKMPPGRPGRPSGPRRRTTGAPTRSSWARATITASRPRERATRSSRSTQRPGRSNGSTSAPKTTSGRLPSAIPARSIPTSTSATRLKYTNSEAARSSAPGRRVASSTCSTPPPGRRSAPRSSSPRAEP